jgi:hypothetical protein
MVRAKSSAMRTAALSQAKEAAYKEAEQCYINDLKSFNSSPNSKQRRPPSLRTITARYKGLISHSTLNRHINGKRTVQEFADVRTRVTQEEADEILKHVLGEAEKGFPFTHRSLKEMGEKILSARHM